uniref:Uncharacterized protein n=1 Tax=Oryza barthii TaxID=65489 RepID=A0A0D3FVP7_9ORYZ
MTSHKHPYLNRNQRQRRTLGHQLLQQAEASALPLAFPTTRTRSGQRRGGNRKEGEDSAGNEEVATADVKPNSCFTPA